MTSEHKSEAGFPMNDDPYQLSRFIRAQEGIFEDVLTELRSGQKRTHWMWFIFPQIDGLGHSTTSRYYAIKSVDEARQYLKHPVLGVRLLKCVELLLAVEGKSASEIFGFPDDLKLKSSMTLFACVSDSEPVFVRVLEKYFDGKRDEKTMDLLGYSPQ
jgi:uncharacterized protein (DUF1810 family)